jgi:Leucine-rich repeat (LRR) protein
MFATSHRRWFRFGLRTLLVTTLLFGVLMAWIAKERRESWRDEEIVAKLDREDFWFHAQFGSPYGHPFHSREDQTWWEYGFERLLGRRVRFVRFEGSQTKDYDSLAQLKKLDVIGIENIHDLSPLVQMKSLRWLWISYSDVGDFAPLAKLKNLEDLSLQHMKVGDLTSFANLKKMRRLELSFTDVRDLAPLAGLKNLQLLRVDRTNVCDLKPLAGLEKLQSLDAESTQVIDISPLAAIACLEGLDVRKTNVSSEQVELLRRSLPQCQIGH